MARWGVEKRVDGIIKWLERFRKSYSSGALENALMDAECAKADIENLRLDIWTRVGSVRVPKRAQFGSLMLGVLAALVILLATAVPLSRDPDASLTVASAYIPAAEPVKVKEAGKPEPPVKTRRESAPPGKKSSVRRVAASAPAAPARTENAGSGAKKKVVPYDKMFSLLQMGERALKNEESVIKVHSTGKGEGKL